MMYAFSKEKMAPLKAALALLIVADHMALFYGVSALRPCIALGAPIVSIFFFISGFGLQSSYRQKGEAYLKGFFSRRIWKVLLPWLLATLLYGLLLRLSPQQWIAGAQQTITQGHPILPFSWYVLEILFFYLAFYCAYRFFPGIWKGIVLLVLVLLFMLLTLRLHYGQGWWVSSLAFPAGIAFACFEKKLIALFERKPIAYWLTLAGLAGLFCLSFLIGKRISALAFTVSHVCIGLTAALVTERLPLEKLNLKIVSLISLVSYEIYLCQGIAMALLRGRWHVESDILFVTLVYLLTIALAWAIHLLSGWMTNKRTPCTSSTT